MKKLDLTKQTLRVLTANEAALVAAGARATDPSRIPCVSDTPMCWRADAIDRGSPAPGRTANRARLDSSEY